MSWETITDALDRIAGRGTRSGDWLRYLCPVHEGDGRRHHPSLGVIYNRQRGKTVVRCFAGCPDEMVLERLGLTVRDLYDRPGAHPVARSSARTGERSLVDRALLAAGLPLTSHRTDPGRALGPPRMVARYFYRDPGGRLVGMVVRMHTPHESGRSKTFWQARMTESGWRPGGFAPIPFLLPGLLAAVANGTDIYVCEGEEDVRTADHAGLAATCNAGGALNWQPAHASWFRGGRRVLIVADRDAPGYRHAARVAATLRPLVRDIRILQARDGKDFTEHCDAGHEIAELDPVPVLDNHFRLP
ncbi:MULTISPECIES: hypothetical protein [unclassified Nocardia]|uniref:hypothetical protein n=1 Tax=unclassified Nocardia TaxID=2637762 RepID=UPI001CE3BCA0|nr:MULTISPECIES: hypothetical protein [unclassified Nocardia]